MVFVLFWRQRECSASLKCIPRPLFLARSMDSLVPILHAQWVHKVSWLVGWSVRGSTYWPSLIRTEKGNREKFPSYNKSFSARFNTSSPYFIDVLGFMEPCTAGYERKNDPTNERTYIHATHVLRTYLRTSVRSTWIGTRTCEQTWNKLSYLG